MQCGDAIVAKDDSASTRTLAVFTPGKINLEALRNTSGVTFSGIGRVTAMPGNLLVYVAATEDLNESPIFCANWPA